MLQWTPAAGLVVDYGTASPKGASVRGIQAHKFVDFLTDPGLVDIVSGPCAVVYLLRCDGVVTAVS